MHGALVRDGEWWWRPTARLLEERAGIRSRALELPSCGEALAPDGSRGLVADATALRQALDELDDGRAVVVGHSYGGTVIAEAGPHPAVARLVLISSYLPAVGESQGSILAGEPDPVAVAIADADAAAGSGAGALELDGYDAETFGARFLHDGDTGVQREAFARLTPQHVESFVTPTTSAGWQGADSTYLLCADDRSTTPGLQRREGARATRMLELPAGHHPFLTRPDLVAEAIAGLVA